MIFISLGCISQQLIKTEKLLGRKCWRDLWGWDISGSSLILNLDESNPCFPFSPWVESSTKKILKGDGAGGSKVFQIWDQGWLDFWGNNFELYQRRFSSDIRRNFSMELAVQGISGAPPMEILRKYAYWGHGLVMVVLGGLKSLFQSYQFHVSIITFENMNLLSKPAEVAARTPPSPNDL